MNYKTGAWPFCLIREAIGSTDHTMSLGDEVELDELCFNGRRKGKRGRGAEHKALIFGMREGKMHVEVGPEVQARLFWNQLVSTPNLGAPLTPWGFRVTPLCSSTGMNTSGWITSVALSTAGVASTAWKDFGVTVRNDWVSTRG